MEGGHQIPSSGCNEATDLYFESNLVDRAHFNGVWSLSNISCSQSTKLMGVKIPLLIFYRMCSIVYLQIVSRDGFLVVCWYNLDSDAGIQHNVCNLWLQQAEEDLLGFAQDAVSGKRGGWKAKKGREGRRGRREKRRLGKEEREQGGEERKHKRELLTERSVEDERIE